MGKMGADVKGCESRTRRWEVGGEVTKREGGGEAGRLVGDGY